MKPPLFSITIALWASASLAQPATPEHPQLVTTAAAPENPVCQNFGREEMEGEKMPDKPTSYSFIVKIDGTLADVVIKETSGNEKLDRLGATCMAAHWRYKPATQDGKPVEMAWRANMVWAQLH